MHPEPLRFELDADLTLRTLVPEDAPELFAVVDSNRHYLRQWLPWLDANTKVEHSAQFIESTHQARQNNPAFQCAVVYKGQIVGMCGFHPIQRANRFAPLGYWLAESATGKGLMSRSVQFFVNHAFEQMDMNKVGIAAAEHNIKSRQIPERLGFVNEGLERDAEFLYDHYVNHVRYGLLKREWRKA